MCGIVGYSGRGETAKILLEGLSRLEYRGYDSAGISFQESGELKAVKKEGKIANLKSALKDTQVKSLVGIGHTRWATHGVVNDTNAHPHMNEIFSIVHNGIIENANELRSELMEKGHKFQSETDSEVFLELLTFYFKENADLTSSIWKAYNKVKGNSAFVIIEKETSRFFTIKRSAPIVCGVNMESKEAFVSSDPYALMGFAPKLFFPEDAVLCEGNFDSKKLLMFYEEDGSESSRYKIQEREKKEEVVSKGNYEHFMLKEIFEQPHLVTELVEKLKTQNDFDRVNPQEIKIIHMIACGTALHAGMVFKNYIEAKTSIKVICDFASEFRYKPHSFGEGEYALFVSQSGETADTIACQEICKEHNLKSISIVNVEGSTLYRNSDANFLSHAGMEIGVASTKAFTQQVLTGFILSEFFQGNLDFDKTEKDFQELHKLMGSILDKESELIKVANEIYSYKGFIFTGRGINYPVALEGALKLKEIAYVHAEGYAAGELKHGPISLIDENMVNIAIITPDLYDKTYSNAQEVKSRRGVMVVIGEEGNKELEDLASFYIGIPLSKTNKEFNPLLVNIVLQLLSYHIAKLKGTDIDKPRNLAKSVTVE